MTTLPGAKRTLDILASLGLLAILFPVMLVIYLMVRRDGGPAIYSHPRVGMNSRLFGCLKFRSMVVNGDDVLKAHLSNDPHACDEWERTRKLTNDPRITRIGAFLRKTSLDELPQLVNVLKGDMSMVGPRPVTESELDLYGPAKEHYLSVRPGITGLWQVSGRSDTTYAQRVALDRKYAASPTMAHDIEILAKTPVVVVTKKGAR